MFPRTMAIGHPHVMLLRRASIFFQDIKSCNLLIYSTIYNLASTAINLTISRPARKMIMSLITTIDDETLTWDTSVTYKNNKGEIYTRTHIYKKQYKFIER